MPPRADFLCHHFHASSAAAPWLLHVPAGSPGAVGDVVGIAPTASPDEVRRYRIVGRGPSPEAPEVLSTLALVPVEAPEAPLPPVLDPAASAEG